jgi:glutamyl/glutaminyl-tRNA synthetase
VLKRIYEALEWLGISPDETRKKRKVWTYRQRKENLYKEYAEQLINTGWALCL